MRILALSFVLGSLLACGGPTKKPEGAIVEGGSNAPDACCCKSFPKTSEDGRPFFENANPMECSSKQGECVDQVQCAGAAPKEEPGEVSRPPLEPTMDDDSAPAVEKP